METVEFNCERCGKLIAVVLVDRGKPVECPHCYATVQAPAAPQPAPPELPVPEFRVPTRTEQESIFTPHEESGEDLFGAVAGPRLEMPAAPALEVESLPGPTEASEEPPLPEAPSAPLPAPPEATPPAPLGLTPEPGPGLAAFLPPAEEAVHHPAAPPEAPPKLPAPAPPRRPQRQSMLGPLLLIFLIPYSLVATAALAWMIYQQRQVSKLPAFDPLERLPDPKAAPDGPKRVKPEERVRHDSPLPDKLKTTLKTPLTIGDIEVTPLAIERTPMGELLLTLKLKNVSRNVAFDPLPDMLVRYAARGLDDFKPYTFIALGPDPSQRIYGAFLDHLKKPVPKGRGRSDNVLWPGEAMTVRLATDRKYKPLVDRLDRPRGPILWRIHLRRGFVQVNGKDVSATAVIGVQIDPGDIPPAPARGALLSPARPLFPQGN